MPANSKSTYELAPDVKLALAMWRAQLRSLNIKATEKGIIEALVRATDVEKVGKLLRATDEEHGAESAS